MLVIMVGFPASGKTAIAVRAAERVGGIVLNKDEVRAALFGPDHIAYTREQDDFCMDVLYQAAGFLLADDPGKVIFIDGRTFSKRDQVAQAVDAARRLGTPARIIRCVVDDGVARERLILQNEHLAANRDFELFRALKAGYEPLEHPHLELDTGDLDLDTCVRLAITYINEETP